MNEKLDDIGPFSMGPLEATVAIVTAQGRMASGEDLLSAIKSVYSTIVGLTSGAPAIVEDEQLVPAVPIKKSVQPDFIICLEDGQKFKSIRRHIGKLGMTPEQYRAKWSLPADYPMVAPNYSAVRSQLAKDNGLGTKR